MRIDDKGQRQREEAQINRVHNQGSYRKAMEKAIKTLAHRYCADIGGGPTYPLITWSGARLAAWMRVI